MSLRSQRSRVTVPLAVRLRDADLSPDPDWILDHPVTAWRKSHRTKLSTGSASDSGTACDD
jgi:hypothetical protein